MTASVPQAPWISRLLFLSVLLPASWDGVGSLELAGFTVRANYFGLALLAFWILLRERSLRWTWSAFSRTERGLLALASVAGLLGSVFSSHPKRSFAFLVWSIGTMVAVPAVVRWFRRDQRWIVGATLCYALALAGVAAFDAVWIRVLGSDPSLGSGSTLGRIFYANVPRAHAWYQEPNYLASYLGLALVLLYRNIEWLLGPRKVAARAALLFGIVATLSKSGLILLCLDSVQGLRWTRARTIVILALVAALAVLASSVLRADFSTNERALAARAALSIAATNPAVGAGPGGAGARLVERDLAPEYQRWLIASGSDPAQLRNDPLSKDLFSELFAEWGALGAFAILAYIYSNYFGGHFPTSSVLRGALPSLLALGVVLATSQTLPRMDLWLLCSLIGILPQPNIAER
jgi:hypothetical protein